MQTSREEAPQPTLRLRTRPQAHRTHKSPELPCRDVRGCRHRTPTRGRPSVPLRGQRGQSLRGPHATFCLRKSPSQRPRALAAENPAGKVWTGSRCPPPGERAQWAQVRRVLTRPPRAARKALASTVQNCQADSPRVLPRMWGPKTYEPGQRDPPEPTGGGGAAREERAGGRGR